MGNAEAPSKENISLLWHQQQAEIQQEQQRVREQRGKEAPYAAMAREADVENRNTVYKDSSRGAWDEGERETPRWLEKEEKAGVEEEWEAATRRAGDVTTVTRSGCTAIDATTDDAAAEVCANI